MNEAIFQKEFAKSCSLNNYFYCKITDPIFNNKTSFSQIRPFDAFAGIKKPYAIEFKQVKGFTFPLKKISEHQIINLLKASNNGFESIIIVNFRKGLGKNRLNICKILNVKDVLTLRKKGIASIKYNEIENGFDWDTERKIWNITTFTT